GDVRLVVLARALAQLEEICAFLIGLQQRQQLALGGWHFRRDGSVKIRDEFRASRRAPQTRTAAPAVPLNFLRAVHQRDRRPMQSFSVYSHSAFAAACSTNPQLRYRSAPRRAWRG